MDLLSLWSQQLVRFLFVLSRTAGIFSIAPILGQTSVPGQVRIILAVALAVAVAPVVAMPPDAVQHNLVLFVVGISREVSIGLAIGFVAALLMSVAQIAGELMDYQIGFGLSGTVDPITNLQMPVISKFLEMFVTLVFLATGAHRFLIRALADSYTLLGPGASANLSEAARPLMLMFISVFIIGVKIAAPILGLLLLCDLVLGLVARTTPQLNLLMVGFPMKIGVGVAAVMVALPVIAIVMANLLGGMYADVLVVVRALGR